VNPNDSMTELLQQIKVKTSSEINLREVMLASTKPGLGASWDQTALTFSALPAVETVMDAGLSDGSVLCFKKPMPRGCLD